MQFKRLIFVLLLAGFAFPSWSQEKGTGPKEKSFKQEVKTNKQIRRERREMRQKEKAERKAIKRHHKRIQTKEVRKRMKKSKGTAIRNNENKREFFMKRWFKKKKKLK